MKSHMNKHILRLAAALLISMLLLAQVGCAHEMVFVSGSGVIPEALSGQGDANETGTELEVYCFQAGAADAFLITTENAAVLIDCGESGFGKTILKELEARGIERLDCLIITHFDQDHVGGAAKVIKGVEIGAVLQSNHPKDSKEYEKYEEALIDAEIDPYTVVNAFDFTLDGVVFSVDPPRSSSFETDDSNNSSLIVTVRNGDNVLLFMGDAETERLAEYLEADPEDCDFLKYPHHGREDDLMEEFLASVTPEYAVITSNKKEPEEDAVLAALDAVGAETFLTRNAPVVVRSDGKTVTAVYLEEASE